MEENIKCECCMSNKKNNDDSFSRGLLTFAGLVGGMYLAGEIIKAITKPTLMYPCKNCGTHVKWGETPCPKCKANLIWPKEKPKNQE